MYPDSDPGAFPSGDEHEELCEELARCLKRFKTDRETKGLGAILAENETLFAAKCKNT